MSIKEITTGQDSFLDIVANLVGILIILVVVVGAQASASWVKTEPNTELLDQIEKLENELSLSSDVMNKLQIDNSQLDNKQLRENQLAAALTDQRHDMLMQLEIAKREMKKKQLQREAKLAADDEKTRNVLAQKNEFSLQKQQLERELDDLDRETNAVAANEPKSEVIKHFPNPIAKTVFSEEVHFRLDKGKLSYVPMDELISRMKSEWKIKAEKLRQANRTIETIGPIRNYRMQYELAAEDVAENTSVGPVYRKTVSFRQFVLLPASLTMGESVADALRDGSEFLDILSRHESRKTTVSIWVYPDSYTEHNQLKDWIHQNGFQMASWPLDHGKKISGGPNGFKTSAQ